MITKRALSQYCQRDDHMMIARLPGDVFLSADTESIVETHTFCTTHVDKNVQNGTFYNGIGG